MMMKPSEIIALRTWWLGGIALWACLFWVAALAGLGQRLPTVSTDRGRAPPLPALPAQPPERLQPLESYADISSRPLFSEDRLPHPYFLGATEAAPSTSVRLTGVLLTPMLRMATLTTEQGESIRLTLQAAPVNGWQLLDLSPRAATVAGPGGTQTLEMQVFDGQGGQPPTVLGANPAAAAARQLPLPPSAAAGAAVPPAAPPRPTSAGGAPVAPPAPAVAPPPPSAAAPSDEQMRAIRERIQARRQQLQQQQQQNNSGTPVQNPRVNP